MYIHIHTYTCTHIHTHTYIHTYIHTCNNSCVNRSIHINLTGVWYTFSNGEREAILLEGNVDTLALTWKTNDGSSRELDWSWGGYDNEFTLAGGHSQRILRWRPTTRHLLFDDDHIVWTAFDTKHRQLTSMEIIVDVRAEGLLKHFQDAHPSDWSA